MQFKSFALIVLLGVMAIGLSLFEFKEKPDSPSSQLEQNDWYIEQARAWHLNTDTTQHYIQANHLRQQNDTIYAQQPRVLIRKPDQKITIRSEQLTITDQDLYEFNTQVNIKQQLNSDGKTQSHQFSTENLVYDQNSALLNSPVAVKLSTSHSQTQGIGFEINLNSQRTQVHSQVKTIYETH
jgi:LPS export ABC transporter protein LptC